MTYRFHDFELDAAALTLRASGRPVDLPRKAVETLVALVERRGSVVGKTDLMDALWPEGFVEEGNLTQYVYLLRRAFRERGLRNVIETHARRGYCFNPPARDGRQRWRVLPRLAAAAIGLLLLAGTGQAVRPRALGGEAEHAYALGRYFWNVRSVDGMQRSVGYFKRVIALAPRSALGYAALADAYTELADMEQPCRSCAGWGSAAKRLAARAVAVDPASPEARVAFGMAARIFDGDDVVAEREFRRALALDPRDDLANQWYGNLLIAHGRLTEGIARLQVAASEQPVATATYAWLARGYYYEGRYAESERYARDALALEPDRLETRVLLGLAQEAQGRYRSASTQFAAASRLGISANDFNALRAGVDAAAGRRSIARAVLTSLARRSGLDIYAMRDIVIGFVIAQDVRSAHAAYARIRFTTTLDRELIAQDPHMRVSGVY